MSLTKLLVHANFMLPTQTNGAHQLSLYGVAASRLIHPRVLSSSQPETKKKYQIRKKVRHHPPYIKGLYLSNRNSGRLLASLALPAPASAACRFCLEPVTAPFRQKESPGVLFVEAQPA